MVQWRTAGLTWYAIAKRLNRDGIRTMTGRSWAGGTVRKLLNSRTVNSLIFVVYVRIVSLSSYAGAQQQSSVRGSRPTFQSLCFWPGRIAMASPA